MEIRFPNVIRFDAAVLPDFVKVARDCRKVTDDGRIILHRATLKSLIQNEKLQVLGGDTILDMVVTLTFGERMKVDGRGGDFVNGIVDWMQRRLEENGHSNWFAASEPKSSAPKMRGGTDRAKYADLGL